MLSTRRESGRQEAMDHLPCPEGWQRARVNTAAAGLQLNDVVLAALAREGYPERDLFAIRLSLEEAIINGIKHGNGYDPAKWVQVTYRITPEQFVAEVEDQGPGFDPHDVPDPLDPENLERASGRGLLLMRMYMTWVRYNDRGNGVTLCKRRSDAR